MNIVVAVDLSLASERVVEAARGIAELTGASIYVLHVVETEAKFSGYDAEPETLRARIEKEFPREHREVQAMVEKLQNDGLDATAWLARGPAVDVSRREIDKLEAGLVVVGTHGRSPPTRVM